METTNPMGVSGMMNGVGGGDVLAPGTTMRRPAVYTFGLGLLASRELCFRSLAPQKLPAG
jgi:hypothetical protein